MIRFTARTILGALATLLLAAAIVFFCLDMSTPQTGGVLEAIGRFAAWIGGMLVGNFGASASGATPIGPLIAARLAVSGPLIVMAAIIAGLVGFGIGTSAARRGKLLDRLLMGAARFGRGVPNFWLGMLLVLLFSVALHWLPAGGFVPWTSNPALSLVSLVLPMLALGLPAGAALAIVLRNAIVNARGSAYVQAARARGLTTQEALRQHGTRNIALAVLLRLQPVLASLVVGSVIVESVFSLPGLGRLLLDAAAARDPALARAGLFAIMLLVTIVVIIVRLATGRADPRISQRAPT